MAGTLTVEPTESETLEEIDRFVDAMIAIREEIRQIERGEWPQDDNPLRHASHTAACLLTPSPQPRPARFGGPFLFLKTNSRSFSSAGCR